MAALAITKQVLNNGNRSYRATYNFQGDGASTISAYLAADGSAAGDMGVIVAGQTYYPLAHLKIWRIRYNLAAGFSVRVIWDATAAQDAWGAFGFGEQIWKKDGGLSTTGIVGASGKILFTADPTAPPANAGGSIELWLKKDFAR